MTVGSDGFIRVWDGADLTETERIPIDDVSAAGWLDEERLLVGTYSGRLLTLVLHRSHVVDLARAGLSRTLSESECATYRLEPCPTSRELRGD